MTRRLFSLILLAFACAAEPPPSGSVPEEPVTEPAEPSPPPEPCGPLDEAGPWLEDFLKARAARWGEVYERPEDHRLQIVVGEIRNEGDDRCLQWHSYRHDAEYIYPASTIKPIAAVAGLQALRARQAEDPALTQLTLDTPIRLELLNPQDAPAAKPRRTTVREELEASLIISDNDAFNFLYDLAGTELLHRLSWDAGLSSIHLHHRLARLALPPGSKSWRPRFVAELDDGREVLLFSPDRPGLEIPSNTLPKTEIGKAYRLGGKTFDEPMDFSRKNQASLFDLARLMTWIAAPSLVPELHDGSLASEDHALLSDIMGRIAPDWAIYQPVRAGVMEVVPGRDLHLISKGGQAYGFRLEVAWVEQKSTGRAFVVAASVYANPNEVLSDGRYAYDTLANPFLTALADELAHALLLDPPQDSWVRSQPPAPKR